MPIGYYIHCSLGLVWRTLQFIMATLLWTWDQIAKCRTQDHPSFWQGNIIDLCIGSQLLDAKLILDPNSNLLQQTDYSMVTVIFSHVLLLFDCCISIWFVKCCGCPLENVLHVLDSTLNNMNFLINIGCSSELDTVYVAGWNHQCCSC